MLKDTIEFDGIDYDARHGGPFDRGSADSYYGRPCRPHYFAHGTYEGKEIIPEVGSEQHEAYIAGYEWNEAYGDKKDWG